MVSFRRFTPDNADYHDPLSLAGQLLVAMPGVADVNFDRAVLLLCMHSAQGSFAITINRPMIKLNFAEMWQQMGQESTPTQTDIPLLAGGPLEADRGFVVHSPDLLRDGTLRLSDDIALSATIEVLQRLAGGNGPAKALVCMGYAGWGPGQLETELQHSDWLLMPADDDLVFDTNFDNKWHRCFAKLGINPERLSHLSGKA
jgi:putative transcriptional regulator